MANHNNNRKKFMKQNWSKTAPKYNKIQNILKIQNTIKIQNKTKYTNAIKTLT